MDARLAGDPQQRLVRRDEVVGAGDRVREARERVGPPPAPGHALEHRGEGPLLGAKPTNIVPWSVTVPYGMLRRKMCPKRSWSVLATCESSGLSSSSTLSSFLRPITSSCSATGSDSHAAASCSHFCSSRIVPPSPGLPSGTSTNPGASISVGFSVPSMKPVRSRSCWYGQLDVSSAIVASPASAAIAAARRVEDHVVGAAGQPQHGVVLRGGHREAVGAGQGALKPSSPGGASSGATVAPELGAEPRDEVDPAHRRPRLAERGDGRHQLLPVAGGRVELEVRVRSSCRARRSRPVDSSSRCG